MVNSPKSIAMLHYAGPPIVGGVESVMQYHAELMREAGHTVRLVVGRGDTWRPDIDVQTIPRLDSMHPEILQAKASLDQGSQPEMLHRLVSELKAELREACRGVDFLIAHNVCTMAKNLPFTTALRQFVVEPGAPRLIAWHHDLAWKAQRYRDEFHQGYPWQHILEPWTETEMKHVVVSQMRQAELCDLFGLTENEVKVIPSGMHFNDFYALDETTRVIVEELELYQHFPIFLLPVRITQRKNIELALEILAALRQFYPDCALVVTGPPGAHNSKNASYFSELLTRRSALALEPGNDTAAYFIAEHYQERLAYSSISSFFRVCDALLIPSSEEGFGIPILEAGLTGMPVFCSSITPFREIAKDFATYFSPTDPPERIAQSIHSHLESYSSLKLRQRVRTAYAWKSIYCELIEPLLTQAESRPTVTPAPDRAKAHVNPTHEESRK